MNALDRLIPEPQLVEIDRMTVDAPAAVVWASLRHGELAQTWPIRTLFKLRTLMMPRAQGTASAIRLDELHSSPDRPGFQILVEDPPHGLAVGAIGKVWRLQIPFVHVANAAEYARFSDSGFAKVAWMIRVRPRDFDTCLVELEVRVSATDTRSWNKFRRYFRVVGPFSRYIRRSLLRAIANRAPLDGNGTPCSLSRRPA
jgi:hypothetical protein